MQRALMERVLNILLEVEKLSEDERAQVQDGLTFIRPDVTETSPNSAPESETFSNLAALINVRYRHQSEEEARAVRVARVQTGPQGKADNQSPEQEEIQAQCNPHRPAAASSDSERRNLAMKINSIIKAKMEALGTGESTGKNRCSRWNTEKRAARSTLPVGEAVAATVNTANSQAAARKTAQAVCFFFKSQLYHYSICSVFYLPCRL